MLEFSQKNVTSLVTSLLVYLCNLQAIAQIDVTYPVNRMVIQRSNANTATVQIAGSYAQPLDVVEARVVARATGQGVSTDWAILQEKPIKGQFNGNLSVRGGWYRVEVRGLRNGKVVVTDSVDRFGVGEVFAIVGHSNAQGSGCTVNGVNLCPSMPGATDDRVTVVALDQTSPDFQQYLNTADTRYLPGLVFSQLQTFNGMAPFAKMAWFWGHMGDVLVQRINVPVLIYNAGFGGTNMEHNYKAAYDIPFTHSFVRYEQRMPYVNLRNLMNLYVPSTGIRAILLNHGENDRENPADLILKHHYGVIDKARQEFNKPDLAWIIALSSFTGKPFENVRLAQLQTINRPGYQTFLGPDLDSISSVADRPDGAHYSPLGQAKAGERWANAITDDILKKITPYEAQQQPLVRIDCATNRQLQLLPPTGSDYSWNTGNTSQSLLVGTGTYSTRVRSVRQETLFPPAVTIVNKAHSLVWDTDANSSPISLPETCTFYVQNEVYNCLPAILPSN
ncbi:sialate O-acetylesterase [Spirosoma validum]|uniref:Sialate O-acetylesterase domain-containing protein n=1 Tax=Spirosoma validum TaxID=2771355 RepID=A0A927GFC8_9BACT|nr:sialate O-acetylesterase [Spirosoma validum]MBD2755470.1 hypothetical protein [Spirosoma validum]